MVNAHSITRDFEAALCEYTGAPHAVAVNSCTMALLLAVAWHLRPRDTLLYQFGSGATLTTLSRAAISIPKRTYVSVPQSIIHAGGRPVFREEDWIGRYQLTPLPVWDCARHFTSGMYRGVKQSLSADALGAKWEGTTVCNAAGHMLCVSFHSSKILGDTQGGAILHDNPEADAWFRRARFDGRAEGVAPRDDRDLIVGWHCYISPDVSARLLWHMATLPKHNDPLPNDDYPDLSTMECFK